ncbi:MAG: gfo/Idh/MocA family oxidoreductase [bacterium]|nr:gfo/Idh/MocA family oxidoreductase [bacterium]
MAKYRVGIIGCGWVSGEHIRAYQNNPLTEVVALASSSMDSARKKAEEFGIGAKCFDSAEAMIEHTAPEVVSICSPPHLHVEHALCAIEGGAQLVMEKPAAMNHDELKPLVQSVRDHQTKSVVSFVLRWNPMFSLIRSFIDGGALGDLYYGEVDYYHGIGPWYKQFAWNVTRRSGGNSFLSAGCHAVDGLVWFMGARVSEVHAFAARSTAKEYETYEYEPTLIALCKFDDGRVGKVSSSIECKAPYMFPIRLFGSRGTIRDNQIFSETYPGQTGFATFPTIQPDSGDVTHHPFQGEIDHFVDCLERGVNSSVPIEYAAHIMEICYAAEQSARTGESVKLPL